MPSALPPTLLLIPVFEALDAWVSDPDVATANALGQAIVRVGEQMGIDVRDLAVTAPPLPELHAPAGDALAPERELNARDGGTLGLIRIAGDEGPAASLAQALALLFAFARERARANRSAGQLRALEAAVRGIGGTVDHDRVLQLIVDEVRVLASARYAAIGIVDDDGITQFITSGMTDAERAAIGALPRGRGLLGLIIREARAYRIADITTHPQRHGFPPNHPAMHSFLGVPITVGDDPVGQLYLTEKIGAAEFDADDEALVEMFALHAALAIEQARLHDQVQRLAIVDERDRISRDLHDSSIQAIYAQTLSLDDVPDLIDDDPDEARRRVDDAIDALHAVINDIRSFIFGLRPVLLEAGGVVDGLAQLAIELRRSSGVEVTVETGPGAGDLDQLPIETMVELMTITREALSNIARHAAADHASVALDGSPTELRLTIRDDGRGFDASRPVERGHLGLANMRARMAGLSGTLEIDSDESGTRIIMALPRPGTASREPDR